jgi:hypothetical protein
MPETPIDAALDAEHLQAIGLVAASWSQLETDVIFSIAVLSGLTRETAVTFLAPMEIKKWLEILQELANRNESTRLKIPQLKLVCREIAKLHPKRNEIVHAHWLPRLKSSGAMARGAGLRKRPSDPETSFAYTAAEICAIAARIQDQNKALAEWHNL